jgi:hypothetical protein
MRKCELHSWSSCRLVRRARSTSGELAQHFLRTADSFRLGCAPHRIFPYFSHKCASSADRLGKAPPHEAIQTSAALPGSIRPTGCSSGVFGEAYRESLCVAARDKANPRWNLLNRRRQMLDASFERPIVPFPRDRRDHAERRAPCMEWKI